MDIAYENEFNVTINIIELINALDKETKLNLIESLLGGCDIESQLDLISNVLADCVDMKGRFAWAKEVIGWLDLIKKQEIMNYTNKLLKKINN